MDRISSKQSCSIGTTTGGFVAGDNSHIDYSNRAGGEVRIDAGQNPSGATTLTWYTKGHPNDTPTPLFTVDGTTAVTQTVPANANTNGASLPIPDECHGAAYLVVIADVAMSASIVTKS